MSTKLLSNGRSGSRGAGECGSRRGDGDGVPAGTGVQPPGPIRVPPHRSLPAIAGPSGAHPDTRRRSASAGRARPWRTRSSRAPSRRCRARSTRLTSWGPLRFRAGEKPTHAHEQHRWYVRVLLGHYCYYGTPHNYPAMSNFLQDIRRMWPSGRSIATFHAGFSWPTARSARWR